MEVLADGLEKSVESKTGARVLVPIQAVILVIGLVHLGETRCSQVPSRALGAAGAGSASIWNCDLARWLKRNPSVKRP